MNRIFTRVKPATALKSAFLFFVFTALMGNVGWGQITLRASSIARTYNTSITINKPAGVVTDDIMIVTISELDWAAHSLTNATSSGWTLISGTSIGGGIAKHCTVLYKVAKASDAGTSSYTFTLPGAVNGDTYTIGGIVAFAGVDPASPFNAIGTLNYQPDHTPLSTVTAPTITTTTSNCAVVMFSMEAYASGCYQATFSSWNTTTPGALTEIFDEFGSWGGYVAIGAAWATKSSSGATGNGTALITYPANPANSNATWGSILVALKPKSTLPVSLLNFTGDCKEGNKTLSWSTASETNNNYFIVERSTDRSNWTVVEKVSGAGNSNTIQQYSLTDLSAEGETIYYRLTQVDFDGASETFDVIAVSCENKNPEISCYPNPFSDQLVVTLQNIGAEQGSLVLRDVTGRVIMQRELSTDDFSQQSVALTLSEIASGVYSLEFRAGSYEKTMRVVKNK